MSALNGLQSSDAAADTEMSKQEPQPIAAAADFSMTDSIRIRGGAGSVMRHPQPPRDMVATARLALNHNSANPEASAAAATALPSSAASSTAASTVPAGFSSASPSTLPAGSSAPAPTLAAAAAAMLPQLTSKCAWFSLQHIHPNEIAALPEFFMQPQTAVGAPAADSGRVRRSADPLYNPFRTPQVYKDYRDWMLLTYHSDPTVYLHVTTCLKFLVADFGSVSRIHRALEGWELINLPSKVSLDTKPSFLPIALPEATNS